MAETLCDTGNRNMSTIVRKTAKVGGVRIPRDEPWESEVKLIMSFVVLFCEKCAEKCQSVRKRAWAFRNWFVGHIGPDSIEHSWNSLAIADSHCLELDYNRCTLVVHNRVPLH
jgi:hypothetical protein